eukprot:scaffold13913_cov84-Skeletonema_dohrnii-CCMP3373.AAC.6
MAEELFIYMGERRPVVPPGATRVIVDESVHIIPEQAFYLNRSIVEFICRDGVKKVGRWAFDGCPSLSRVIMPGVKVVASFAFDCCVALRYVACGKLKRIEVEAFRHCESLTSIDLPSVEFVGESAFTDCTALTNVKFGKELESIGEMAFYKCTSLEQITIPLKDGMFDHDNIFQGCEKLERIDLVGGEIQQVNIAIAAFLMEDWRKDMNEAIDSINQILPDTPAGDDIYNVGKKAFAIREWITNVLRKFSHYQTQHRLLLKEAMTTVELAMWKKSINERDNAPERVGEEGGGAKRRITCGADGAKATGPTASSAGDGGSTAADSSMEINVHVEGLTIPITLTHEKCTSTSSGELCKDFVENSLTNVDPKLILQILTKISPAERLTHYVMRYGDGYSSIIHVEWSSAGIPGFVRLPLVPAYIDVNMTLKPRKRGAPTKAKPHLPLQPAGISLPTSIDVNLCISLVSAEEPPYPSNVARTSVVHLKEHGKFPGCVDTFSVEAADGQNNILPETAHVVEASTAAAAIVVTTATAAAGKKRKASENTESDPTRGECRVKCGADIVIKNVLPFLGLPPNVRRGIFYRRSDEPASQTA